MLPLSYNTRRRYGFTLVELLVVVLILAILLSIALPLYTAAIADSEKKAARTNMQTIANAVAAYQVRDLNHAYPTNINLLVNSPTNPGDLITIPTGPGNRTYILLGIAGDTTAQCVTPVAGANGTIVPTMTPIPAGGFGVTTILTINGTPTTQGQSTAATDDWCYIPGVSVE